MSMYDLILGWVQVTLSVIWPQLPGKLTLLSTGRNRPSVLVEVLGIVRLKIVKRLSDKLESATSRSRTWTFKASY